ncbi:polyprenol monophosphomannose synthase [Botrimarina sp.]|uniref:polyprenol monophosphomannose synthase n=1 Tax=Botrimarina sp. TaxID=2795802 RepID=UPI0032EC8327
MAAPRTLVAIATYNEIENLPTLVDAVQSALPEADVLVVDDASPDGTGRWADERARCDPRVEVLHRAGKLGLGSATFAAMRRAIDGGYDVVCTLDADWSHPPDRLPDLVAALARADVAIGSRYAAGGAIEGWPWRRHVMSRVVNVAAKGLLRLPVRDSSGAFRAYRVEKLRGLDFGSMRSSGYAYLEEILWRLKRLGASFAETPITFTERRAGASKINRGEASAAAGLLLRLGAQEWLGPAAAPFGDRKQPSAEADGSRST